MCNEMLLILVYILTSPSDTRGDAFQPVLTTCIYWDSLTRYTNGEKQSLHCILDENGIEGLVNTTWKLIESGYCPIFNRHSQQIDAVRCNNDIGRCPDIDILSNQAVQYNACYDSGIVGSVINSTKSQCHCEKVLVHGTANEDNMSATCQRLLWVITVHGLLVMSLFVSVALCFLKQLRCRIIRRKSIDINNHFKRVLPKAVRRTKPQKDITDQDVKERHTNQTDIQQDHVLQWASILA